MDLEAVATAVAAWDPDMLTAALLSAGPWTPAVFALLVFAVGLLPLPRHALTLVGAAVLGASAGASISWAASLGAATTSYLLGRALVSRRSGAESRVAEDAAPRRAAAWMTRVRSSAGRHHFEIVLWARIAPVVPFSLINYGAGALRVRSAPFVAATALGTVPSTAAYAYVGGNALTSPWLALAAVGAAAAVTIARGLHRRRQSHSSEHPVHNSPTRVSTPSTTRPLE